MYDKVKRYAVPAVAKIIPLDPELCRQMVDYALTLKSDAQVQTHLLELLGHSEESYKFTTTFITLKREDDETKAKLAPNPVPKAEPKPNAWKNHNVKNDKLEQVHEKPAAEKLVSQLADDRPSEKRRLQQEKKSKKKTLDNLQDIEAALIDLEVQNAEETVAVRRCNCMATRHPLFEVAPNCLNCGKIICAKEGLQPCSYCGRELLLPHEKDAIRDVLEAERSKAGVKTTVSQPKQESKQNKIKFSLADGNLWKAQEAALKKANEKRKAAREAEAREQAEAFEIEEQRKELERYEKTKDVDQDLLKAQERLDSLLQFQASGAERTRIIDNAADFEVADVSSGSMWLSPVERALQLKKQQKLLRKIKEQEKERTGRSNKVMDMVIRDGKVLMVERLADTSNAKEDNEIEALQSDVARQKMELDATMATNIWDYEQEQDKWEKPVYQGKDAPSATSQEVFTLRVQYDELDSDELVSLLP